MATILNCNKEDMILAIRRNKQTKAAERYEWVARPEEEVKQRIAELNVKDDESFYEICADPDMRALLPLPLSRRQHDINDIVDRLETLRYEVQDLSSSVDELDDTTKQILRDCEKVLQTEADDD